jgi:hypothetical protein
VPLARTEFVLSSAGMLALENAILNSESDTGPGFVDDTVPHPVRPGGRRSQSWFRSPFVLNPYDFPGSCQACRTATELSFLAAPTDAVDGHFYGLSQIPGGEAARLTVKRDGTTLLDEVDLIGASFTVPAAAGSFQITQTADRAMDLPRLSRTSTSEWTFRSGAGQGSAPPPGTECPIGGGTGCRVLPLLKAVMDLHPTIEGRVPPGRRSFDLVVGRIEGATPAPVTAVKVEVQPSGSTTWRSLPVTTAGPGHYRITFTSTAAQAGQKLDLRVTAVDATGSRLRQTTTSAIQVDGLGAPRGPAAL